MMFTLINPVIVGSFEKKYDANNAEEAGKMFWEAFAVEGKYISGNVPKFMFTMMGGSNNALHHFVVSETPNGKVASYSLKKIDLKLTQNEGNNLIKASKDAYENANKLAQNGGKHKKKYDDDSSTSDSSDDDVDDLFRNIRIRSVAKPFVYWWYSPTVYKVENIWTPTFVPAVAPLYNQIWIPLP